MLATRTFAYDPRGNQVRVDTDTDGDGNVDAETLRTFDEADNLVSEAERRYGEVISSERRTYDERGRLATVSSRRSDGTDLTTLAYDCQ